MWLIILFLVGFLGIPALGMGQTNSGDLKFRSPVPQEVTSAKNPKSTPERDGKWRQKVLGKEKKEQKIIPQEPLTLMPLVLESKPEIPAAKNPEVKKQYQRTGRTTVVD